MSDQLTITYEQFVKLLKVLDKHMSIVDNYMPRGFPQYNSDGAQYGYVQFGAIEDKYLKSSEVTLMLWKILEAGPAEVDRIRNETFAKEQVAHFKKTYTTTEELAEKLSGIEMDDDKPLSPIEMFQLLGQPAQMNIVRNDLLQPAVKAYEQAMSIIEKKQAKADAEEARRQEAKAQRAAKKNKPRNAT